METLRADVRQAVLSYLFRPLIVGVLGCASLFGCATGGESRNALQFSDGVTDEPQIQRAIARFCDSGYIAVNQSQDMSQGEIVGRFQEMKAQRQKWTSGIQVAELMKASLVSNRSAGQIVRVLIEMEGELPKSVKAENVAELAKLAAITEWEPSAVAKRYKQFAKARKWKLSTTPVELTKVAVFTDKEAERVLETYDELKLRQGRRATESELTELTKVSTLTGKSPNSVVKVYDQVVAAAHGNIARGRSAEFTKIALLTGASPRGVVSRFNDLMARRQLKLSADRAVELTKISLLGKRSVEDVVKTYVTMQSLETMENGKEQMNALASSLLSGELLQDSVLGDNIDECNGAYARLFLSIDGLRSEEG